MVVVVVLYAPALSGCGCHATQQPLTHTHTHTHVYIITPFVLCGTPCSIGGNKIGCEGAAKIMAGLASNTALKELEYGTHLLFVAFLVAGHGVGVGHPASCLPQYLWMCVRVCVFFCMRLLCTATTPQQPPQPPQTNHHTTPPTQPPTQHHTFSPHTATHRHIPPRYGTGAFCLMNTGEVRRSVIHTIQCVARLTCTLRNDKFHTET